MDAKQHLYYALGIMAYAVAKADGKVQNEERQMIHKIVVEKSGHEIDFDYAEIIFSILQKEKQGASEVYQWAMNAFNLGKHHLTPEMKKQFIAVIKQIAEAYPPKTIEEIKWIDKISRNIWLL
ncbi:MAG: TerB family tellurite resistance protein [Bacteroidetes bacterium]|nr:TerB family tellurite resistance protein [Bacteroidota bacterium]